MSPPQGQADFKKVIRKNGPRSSGDEVDAVVEAEVLAGTITIDGFSGVEVISPGTINVSGTYDISSGSIYSIQARFDDGEWQIVDVAPSDGQYSGTFDIDYGQGSLEVRINNSGITDSVELSVLDVYLIAGQSKAAGSATNQQDYVGLLGSKMYKNGSWQTISDPILISSNSGSSYPVIANILEQELGRPSAFVIGAAAGGSGLVNPANWAKGGGNYNSTLSIVENSGVNKVDAVLWYQGERDAKSDILTANYKNALSQMLDDFQADSSAMEDTPLIAAIIGPSDTATDEQIDQIRQAVFELADEDPEFFVGPDASSYFDPVDDLHWTTDQEIERLANMWSRTIIGHLYEGESPLGPVVATTTIGGDLDFDTFEIEFDSVGDIVGTDSVVGWSVLDEGGEVTVQSMSKSGNTITLVAERDLFGDVYVTYASGDNARESNLTDSGTLVGMPIQPIKLLYVGVGAGAPQQSSLIEGLVAWWPLEEVNGDRADSSDNANTLVQTNIVGSGAGVVGNAAHLVANSNFPALTAADSPSMDFSNGFSVSMWFKKTTKISPLSKIGEYQISWSANTLIFYGYSAVSGWDGRKIQDASDIIDGNWHHLVVTYPVTGPSNGSMWIDGVRRDTSSNFASPGWSAWNNTANSFQFFKQSFGGETTQRWMDEVAIWNRELTENEISSLYNEGSGMTFPE